MQLTLSSPQDHLTATEFVTSVTGLDRTKREIAALDALLSGHVPSHMRTFVDVTIAFSDVNAVGHTLTINVLPDYLSIGNDADLLRMPLSPLGAQKVCDAWGCVLPTTKLVTIIWNAASTKIVPQPWGPPYDASMMSTSRIVAHNVRVEGTLKKMNVTDRTKLTAGHKKDVVITKKLVTKPKQVAIFGWHKADGKPIQPLYLGHENTYLDYSHGIRLISRSCVLDGQADDLTRIMQDSVLFTGVSSEGPMPIVSQPPA